LGSTNASRDLNSMCCCIRFIEKFSLGGSITFILPINGGEGIILETCISQAEHRQAVCHCSIHVFGQLGLQWNPQSSL